MNKWETDNKIKIKFMKKPRLGIIVVAIIALFSCGTGYPPPSIKIQ